MEAKDLRDSSSPAAPRNDRRGGFFSILLIPGEVELEARVAPLVLARPLPPLESQIPVRYPAKGVFWPLSWLRLAFFAFKNQFVFSVLKC
jgi:hypothetical protein